MDSYLNTLSPYIRIASDSQVHPPWQMPERVIFDYELLYVKGGHVRITIGERTYEGHPGDLFLFKPKEPHTIKVIGDEIFHQPHLHFDLFYQENSPDVKVSFKALEDMNAHELTLFRQDLTKEADLHMPNYIPLSQNGFFEEKLFEIIRANEMKMPYYQTQMKGLFIQLWTYLVREVYWHKHPHTSTQMETLNKIKDYITNHATCDIALTDIAATFNMSKYHLIRLFKQVYHMTPIHYHQLIRIEKAKELIQFTDKTITEIADELGFTSIHSFSRAFKKVDKVAPSYYRRRSSF